MANAAIVMGLGFLFWVVAARWFDPYQVGIASTLISSTLLLGNLSRLGLGIGLVRFLASYEDRARMISTCFVLPVLASTAFGAIFLLLTRALTPSLGFLTDHLWQAGVFLAFLAVWSPMTILDSIFISHRKAQYVAAKQSILAGLRFPLVWILAPLGAMGIYGAWGLSALSALLASVFILFPIATSLPFPRPSLSLSVARFLFKFSSANYVAFILSSLPANLLPVLITTMIGSDVTAYFYISWTIANVIFFIPNAVGGSFLAEGAADPASVAGNARRSITFSYLFVLPAAALLFLAGGPILEIFGKAYSEGALSMLRLLCLSGPFVVLTNIYVARMNAEKRLSNVVIVNAITTGGTLLAYFFLVSRLGLVAIGFGWILSQALSATFAISTGLLRRD